MSKGPPLTMRTVRLDDDVWAECQRLGKVHGTINEGMAVAHEALKAGVDARVERLEAQLHGVMNSLAASQQEVERLRARLVEPDVTAQALISNTATMRRFRGSERVANARPFKGPIPKPKDKKI